MADIINLRMARKGRARATAEAEAAINRAAFGRTRAEKQAADSEREREARTLNGARRDDPST